MVKFQHPARQTAARTPQMKPAPLLLAAALLALLGTGQAAQAQIVACDGQTISTGNNTSGHPFGPHLLEMEIPTVLGDRITVISGQFSIDDYTGRGLPGTLTAGQTFTITQEIVDLRGRADGHSTYIQNENYLRNPDPYAAPVLTYQPSSFRCESAASLTPPVADEATPTAAAMSVSTQTSATQSAITTNIAGRFGAGGFSAGANNIFVSSRGLDAAADALGEPELNAWVALEGRRFTGTSTGDSRSITFGIDRLVNPDLVIGGFIGLGDQTVTSAGTTTATSAPLIGAYGARKINDTLFLTGFAGYGRPEYSVGAQRGTATRRLAGVALNGSFAAQGLTFKPAVSVLASQEDMPALGTSAADTLRNVQGQLDLRVEPQQRLANGLLPYARLAADFNRQSSNAGETDSFTKPRIGFGADWQLASGTLRLDVDYGSINSGTNDLGAALTYDFRF